MDVNSRLGCQGFTLVEALVALLVTVFGTLALARLHVHLTLDAEAARLQSEATRLAQEKLEELRAFRQLTAAPGVASYEGMESSDDRPLLLSNTRFTRSWRVSGTGSDLHRPVSVQIAWNDRAGERQALALFSIISRSDPTDGGGLAIPSPGNGIPPQLKGRSPDIPLPAIKLAGHNLGKSTWQWGGSSGSWLVFNDRSGNVIATCATRPGDSTDTTSAAAGCRAMEAHLLLGYLSGSRVSSVPSGSDSVNLEKLQYVKEDAAPLCQVSPAVDHNTGAVISGHKSYACLIQPTGHEHQAGTPGAWSGRLKVTPFAPHGIPRVCRHDHNETDASGMYHRVGRSLLHQNYLLIENSHDSSPPTRPCPSGTTQHES